MKIGLAGVRGSIPAPSGRSLFDKKSNKTSKYGGNTTCIYVEADDGTKHIIDAGSGIRTLGLDLMRNGNSGSGLEANLYITHTHWDHIQGLPFFVPAYIPSNEITVFGEAKVRGVHPDTRVSLEEAISKHSDQPGNYPGILSVEGEGIHQVLAKQQEFRNFPAPLEAMQGIKGYYDFVAGATIYKTPTLKIETLGLNHPGNSISYKFTETAEDGTTRIFVCSTDFEPDENGYDDEIIDFWAGADLVFADAQYEPRDSELKINPFMPGYGHSDYNTDIWMATQAEAKTLVLIHHEPKMTDPYHDDLNLRAREESKRRAKELKSTMVLVEVGKEGTWYKL